MKNFAITGAAGYIAPRHLKAIKDTGNNLVAAVDPNDSVGILDRYFPETSFFTEFERFDRHLEMLRRKNGNQNVNYVSICSPNHLHDAHIRLALRIGADAICEKPLVLNPWNLDALQELEEETGQKIYNILQLRVHPSILALKQKLMQQNGKRHDVVLTYITSRGPWYRYSWKGDVTKSGGIATNIGIHFFDLLMWLFGEVKESSVYLSNPERMSGFLSLEHADVRWFLSTDKNDLPQQVLENKKMTYRSIQVDGSELEFTDGFTDLHTKVYEEILNGRGFGIEDARTSIETVYKIRTTSISGEIVSAHPMMKECAGGII
jgi:UDP-N-acetyl-2-amino-2-deoxyglucuronate dehydrogenase